VTSNIEFAVQAKTKGGYFVVGTRC
jgi:hypothetical protein